MAHMKTNCERIIAEATLGYVAVLISGSVIINMVGGLRGSLAGLLAALVGYFVIYLVTRRKLAQHKPVVVADT